MLLYYDDIEHIIKDIEKNKKRYIHILENTGWTIITNYSNIERKLVLYDFR